MQFNEDDYIVVDHYFKTRYGSLLGDVECSSALSMRGLIDNIATNRNLNYEKYYKNIKRGQVGSLSVIKYVIWLSVIYCCAHATNIEIELSAIDVKDILEITYPIRLLLDKPGQSKVLNTKEFIKGAAEDILEQYEDKIIEILKELDV